MASSPDPLGSISPIFEPEPSPFPSLDFPSTPPNLPDTDMDLEPSSTSSTPSIPSCLVIGNTPPTFQFNSSELNSSITPIPRSAGTHRLQNKKRGAPFSTRPDQDSAQNPQDSDSDSAQTRPATRPRITPT